MGTRAVVKIDNKFCLATHWDTTKDGFFIHKKIKGFER